MHNLWRIFIPSWRFYNRAGTEPALWLERAGVWKRVDTRPPIQVSQILFNPRGNAYLAHQNLLERLIFELSADGSRPAELISFRLVRALSGALPGERLKVTSRGEDILLAKAN